MRRADERQEEQKAWGLLSHERTVSIGELIPLTMRALSDYLDKAPSRPDIVHYFGHGVYKDGKGYLLFDKQDGGLDLASVERLAATLGEVHLHRYQRLSVWEAERARRLAHGHWPSAKHSCWFGGSDAVRHTHGCGHALR